MKRALIVSASVVAMCVAAPAHAADPNAVGTFAFKSGAATATWIATPCEDDSNQCIHVSASGMPGQQPWNADAFWSVGSWILKVDQPDALTCDDGAQHAGLMTYSWKAATFEGWAGIFNGGVCGGKAHTISAPFTLTRTA